MIRALGVALIAWGLFFGIVPWFAAGVPRDGGNWALAITLMVFCAGGVAFGAYVVVTEGRRR